MLFCIDETWQVSENKKYKAGGLSAIPIDSREFNRLSFEIFNIKKKHLGFQGADLELKGQRLFQRYYFRLEAKGIRSHQLDLARDIFTLCEQNAVKTFASVTFAEGEVDLACANANQLERPFFYLFERINQYMIEEHPDMVAKLVFDDRGVTTNQRIAQSVSNFFHKSVAGKSYDKILKVPFFAISNVNIGIQLADIMGHVIGRRLTGDHEIIMEFFKRVKNMEFESRQVVDTLPDGTEIHRRGIKVIKSKGELPEV